MKVGFDSGGPADKY